MDKDQTSRYFEDKIKKSSPMKRAVTNQVFDTGEGTVIKKYSSRPLQSVLFSSLSLFLGRPVFLTRKVRRERDQRMKQILQSAGFKAPSVVKEGERYLEVEKIDAESMPDWIRSQRKAKDAGKLIGKFLSEIHQRDLAFLDSNLDNFLTDGESLWSIDHEYSVTKASPIEKELDILMMFASALSINYKYYEDFRAGFESSYRNLSRVETMVSSVAALVISVLVRRNLDGIQNVVKNLLR